MIHFFFSFFFFKFLAAGLARARSCGATTGKVLVLQAAEPLTRRAERGGRNASNWAVMEAAGAVFLPAAGQRTSSNTTNVGTAGNYWTTSHVNGTTGYTFHIGPNANQMQNSVTYSTGCSVRLVREY